MRRAAKMIQFIKNILIKLRIIKEPYEQDPLKVGDIVIYDSGDGYKSVEIESIDKNNSVWDLLCNNPESSNEMRYKSLCMMDLTKYFGQDLQKTMDQLKIDSLKADDLLSGRISKFTAEELTSYMDIVFSGSSSPC